MNELKYTIKTVADLKGLEDLKRAQVETAKATRALGKDTSHLEAEIKHIDAALESEAAHAVRAAEGIKKAIDATKATKGNTKPLEKELAGLRNQYGLPQDNPLLDAAGKLPGVGKFITEFQGAGGALAGLAAAFAGAAKSLNEYAAQEEKITSLDAALAQNQLLTEKYRESLQNLAGELQNTTGVADDTWFEALARLTQFGSNPKTIGMDIEAVKNLAGLLGGDVTQAAEAYSRALQGNYEIFSRYGIQIEATGTQTEKLAALQQQLADRGGGQLEARNKSINGQWRQMKNNLGDVAEAFGGLIAQTGFAQNVFNGLASSFGWLSNQLSDFTPVVDGLENSLKKVQPSSAAAEAALKRYGDEVKAQTDLSKAFEDALNRETDAIVRKQRALDEITDAKMAQALAAIDTAEKNGAITPAEATSKRAGIRSEADNQKYLHALASRTQTIQNNEQDIARLNRELADKKAKADQTDEASKRVTGHDQAVTDAEKEGRRAEKYWQGQKEGLEAFLKISVFPWTRYQIPGLGVDLKGHDTKLPEKYDAALAMVEEQIRKAGIQKNALLQNAENTHPIQPGDKDLAATSKQREDDWITAQQKNTERINQLSQQNQQLKDEINQLTTKQQVVVTTAQLTDATARQEAQTKAVAEPFPGGTVVTAAVAIMQQAIAKHNAELTASLKEVAKNFVLTGELSAQSLELIKQRQDQLDRALRLQQKQLGDLSTKVRHRD